MNRNCLAKIFLYLYPYRKYCLVIAALCSFALIYIFIAVSAQQQDALLVPIALTLVWVLTFYLSICVFQPIALSVNKSSFSKIIKQKLYQWLKKLLVFIFIVITLAVISFSFRLFNALS
ncbi:MAG: hypothetical protein ACI9LM_002136 [Alteromonadaceae bacterium]|jgi:hypothetical protein